MPGDHTRLSVCIPTYNFGRFIGETLRSVVSQAPANVEILVLDSASTDDTESVVEALAVLSPNVRYVRAQTRGGIDRDMARVVELATGEYCWLFSADDVMNPGAIGFVLNAIRSGDDVYLASHSNHTLDMEMTAPCHPVMRAKGGWRGELAEAQRSMDYFARALTTEAFFSFMGSLIVRRQRWLDVPLNEKFVGSCWAHVARLFELAQSSLKVHYLDAVLLQRRGGNDSFATDGTVRRYALAIDGFMRLAASFWGTGSMHAFHVRRVLRQEFPLTMLLSAKVLCERMDAREDQALLGRLVVELYSDRGWGMGIQRLCYRWFPARSHRLLRAAYRASRYLRPRKR